MWTGVGADVDCGSVAMELVVILAHDVNIRSDSMFVKVRVILMKGQLENDVCVV